MIIGPTIVNRALPPSPVCSKFNDGKKVNGENKSEEEIEKQYVTFRSEPHKNDCEYHRFLHALQQALRFGVNTYAINVKNPAYPADKSASKTIPQVVLCFDSAIAEDPKTALKFKPQCGNDKTPDSKTLSLAGTGLNGVEAYRPNFRSAFAIFGYLGDIIRQHEDVRLVNYDDSLFQYEPDGTGCFVKAESYCIPNGGANHSSENSKQLLSMLNALIALSTKPSALPITPTVQLIP